MTRRITYANQLANSLFALQDQKEFMVELGQLTGAVLGVGQLLWGFPCTPTSPPGLSVNLGPGTLFSYQNIDNTPFGEMPSQIPADTNDQITKLAYTLNPVVNFPIIPPVTSGFSRNDLLEISFQEQDGALTSIAFFNGIGNPPIFRSVNVQRIDSAIVTYIPGTPAPTGTQVTPSPTGTAVGAWVITSNHGDTAINSGAISMYNPANFITESLTQKVSIPTGDLRWARLNQILFKNGVINGNMIVAQRQNAIMANTTEAIGLVDAMTGLINASVFTSATLTQATALAFGSTQTAALFTNCSFTSGTVSLIHRIESFDSLAYNNQAVSTGLIVKHDTGSTLNYTINISYATAVNDFTTVVSVATSPAIPVASGTAIQISFPNVTLPNVTNGIQITITASIPAASANNFWFTDLLLNEGSSLATFVPQEYSYSLSSCLRRYQKSYDAGVSVGSVSAAGVVSGTCVGVSNLVGAYIITTFFGTSMIYNPTTTVYSIVTANKPGFITSSAGVDIAGSPSATSTKGFYVFNSVANNVMNTQYSYHWEAVADL